MARFLLCTRNCRTNKKQRRLRLLPPEGLLYLIAIKMLSPLPKTEGTNRYIVVNKDFYSKLKKFIRAAKMTTIRIANIFKERCVENFGISPTMLTENGPQFTTKLFFALCKELGVKKVLTTEYHQQVNGKIEQFNATMVSRVCHHVVEHQEDWDTFMFPLTYACNVRVYRTIKLPPFRLKFIRLPPGPANRAGLMPPAR